MALTRKQLLGFTRWDEGLSALGRGLGLDALDALSGLYGGGEEVRQRIHWLLRSVPFSSEPAYHDWLIARIDEAPPARAEALCDLLCLAKGTLPEASLKRLLDTPCEPYALYAFAMSCEPQQLALVAARLNLVTTGPQAALCLAYRGATQYTQTIIEHMHRGANRDQPMFLAALKLMDDPAAIEPLTIWMATCEGSLVSSMHRCLESLTRTTPVLPMTPDMQSWVRHARDAWRHWVKGDKLNPWITTQAIDAAQASLTLHHGHNRLTVMYESPTVGSSWSTWWRLLGWDRQPLYRLSSVCGTCESFLKSVGTPQIQRERELEAYREAVAHVDEIDDALVAAISPLLTLCQSGHYAAFLCDLQLEHVQHADDSWLSLRGELRPDDDSLNDPSGSWPGIAHWQLTDPLSSAPPVFSVLVPTQEMTQPDEDAIKKHRVAIEAGDRPCAVILGWAEQRYLVGAHPEAFLFGAVLDGHHKLRAYDALGLPARVLWVFRLEDCDLSRSGDSQEALAQLLSPHFVEH